jgi:dolichol-phosphate mannosyltransferase
MRRLGLVEMPATGADFLLIDRKVVDAVNAITERHTSFLAMILWMGFRQTSIPYVKEARSAGRSKWTLSKKIKLVVDSVVSFSYAPIRLVSWFGLGLALCGFLYAVFVIIGWFLGFVLAGVGFAALMTVLLIGQGAILVSLGVIGEYLWRAFEEARGRPRYIVEEYFSSASEHGLSPVVDSNGDEAKIGPQSEGGRLPRPVPGIEGRSSIGPLAAGQPVEHGKPSP